MVGMQGPSSLTASLRLPFPLSLATVVQAAGTFHRIEVSGKAAPQNAGCAPQPPSHVTEGAVCLAPASLRVDSWHGEKDRVPAQPLHPLNAFQPCFTELFTSLASLEGLWVSSK